MTVDVNVCVFNIFTPVPEPLRIYGQKERCERVKDVVKQLDQQYNLDVLILNEVIAPYSQATIKRDMKAIGFVHYTDKLLDVFSIVNGGILIFSKHPIVQQDYTIFGDKCMGTDCFAAKGVSYARIKKGDLFVNVFGTHLQAWPAMKAHQIRSDQIKQSFQFIQKLNIPASEPVLYCGDLNTDLYLDKEYIQHLSYTLQMEIPLIADDSQRFTVDPKENTLVGNDDPGEYVSDDWPNGCQEEYYKSLECPCCPAQWIDYTLYSRKHLLPKTSSMRAIKAKVAPFKIMINATKQVEIQDVSDHFPVIGHFVFDPIKSAESVSSKTQSAGKLGMTLTENTFQVTSVSIIIVVAAVVFFICSFLVYRHVNQKSDKKEKVDPKYSRFKLKRDVNSSINK